MAQEWQQDWTEIKVTVKSEDIETAANISNMTVPYGICLLYTSVEVWHPLASDEDVERLAAICKKKKLLLTGGSDFHGIYGDKTVTLGAVSYTHLFVSVTHALMHFMG